MKIKKHNRIMVIYSLDLLAMAVTWLMAYCFRFNFDAIPSISFHHALIAFPIVAACQLSSLWIFKSDSIIWRYVSLYDVFRLMKAVVLGMIMSMAVIDLIFHSQFVSRSVLPLHAILFMGAMISLRSFYRLAREGKKFTQDSKRVLVIGAGNAGESLIRDMLRHVSHGYVPAALLDDDPSLIGREVHGVKVAAKCSEVERIVDEYKVELIVIAMPSIDTRSIVKMLIERLSCIHIPIRTLPGLTHLAEGQVNINELRDIVIEDLLGREPVSIHNELVSSRLKEKVVLVTGGGGSIGSELCRQIAIHEPIRLVIFENNELNLYNIQSELYEAFPNILITALLVNIAEKGMASHYMDLFKPDVVFHAAAYKHVPILESQILPAVMNNIIGTKNIADLADKYKVSNFILVSTDKAVNPTSLMGMTKRLAEIYCQNLNSVSETAYSTVRFGNVLGSTGSVVPLFRKQLENGGPITVTHSKMTRYFMTIPEASSLILQAFTIGSGGEIFVLDMGEPVKIVDLAEQMIRLSGKKPYDDIDIVFSGVRPGEKLYEELFHGGENLLDTENAKIYKSKSRMLDWDFIVSAFEELIEKYHAKDTNALWESILKLIPENQSVKVSVELENA